MTFVHRFSFMLIIDVSSKIQSLYHSDINSCYLLALSRLKIFQASSSSSSWNAMFHICQIYLPSSFSIAFTGATWYACHSMIFEPLKKKNKYNVGICLIDYANEWKTEINDNFFNWVTQPNICLGICIFISNKTLLVLQSLICHQTHLT